MEEKNIVVNVSLDAEKLKEEVRKLQDKYFIKNVKAFNDSNKTNHTLDDLRQKLINELYDRTIISYEMLDIEILKILFS